MAGKTMIAAWLALQLTAAPSAGVTTHETATAVTYEHVPPEIVRVSLYAWHDAASPVAVAAGVERQSDRVIVRAASERRSLVVLERADGAYLVDGPLWWPSTDT